MSTLGYKIGLFNSLYRHDLFPYNSGRARWAIKTYPALITLEIPDDAVVSTPDTRYNILSSTKFEDTRLALLHELENYNALFPLSDDDFLYALKTKITVLESFGGIPNDIRQSFVDDRIHALKCRCNKAKVTDIRLLEEDGYLTECYTKYRETDVEPGIITRYRRNKFIYPNDFDLNILTICGNGIHYFEDPRLAILYAFNFYGPEVVSQMDYEYVINKYFDISNKED